MVIRTTKRSFAGADLSYPLPDTNGAPGFRLSAPEANDMAQDLVFIISRDHGSRQLVLDEAVVRQLGELFDP